MPALCSKFSPDRVAHACDHQDIDKPTVVLYTSTMNDLFGSGMASDAQEGRDPEPGTVSHLKFLCAM